MKHELRVRDGAEGDIVASGKRKYALPEVNPVRLNVAEGRVIHITSV
jgi:leucyl aminopeptidase (aminopeptidase T)